MYTKFNGFILFLVTVAVIVVLVRTTTHHLLNFEALSRGHLGVTLRSSLVRVNDDDEYCRLVVVVVVVAVV